MVNGNLLWHINGVALYLLFPQVEPEFRNVGLIFVEEGARRTARKTLGAGKRTNNKLNAHTIPDTNPGALVAGKASALANAPSLLPPPNHQKTLKLQNCELL